MTRVECMGGGKTARGRSQGACLTLACVALGALGAVAQADPAPTLRYQWLLDTDPGWGTDGEWAFGQPLGLGGYQFGNPDPASAYTGQNVYGVNLNGDYATTIGGPYYLTAGPIDMTGVTGAKLRFWRWLNTDWLPWVSAKIEVSNDYTNWTTLWENAGVEITDDAWNQWELDIAAVADDQPTVWIRWSHEVLTGGTWAYSGWNVDDVEIWGVSQPCGPGDLDCDGDVDMIDYAMLEPCFAGPGQGLAPVCTAADLDDDSDCDMEDFASFQLIFAGQ